MSHICECGHFQGDHRGGCCWDSCGCEAFESQSPFQAVGFEGSSDSWMVCGPDTGDGAPIYASGMSEGLAKWLANRLNERCSCGSSIHTCLPAVGRDA